eukprot:GHVN01000602.1.p3 GENE.GHVN01000602.1~~GHVN01000602.1.p3  ORF type:complete len:326 (+),score=44.66 GHVN01000602.1:2606-3583(+)
MKTIDSYMRVRFPYVRVRKFYSFSQSQRNQIQLQGRRINEFITEAAKAEQGVAEAVAKEQQRHLETDTLHRILQAEKQARETLESDAMERLNTIKKLQEEIKILNGMINERDDLSIRPSAEDKSQMVAQDRHQEPEGESKSRPLPISAESTKDERFMTVEAYPSPEAIIEPPSETKEPGEPGGSGTPFRKGTVPYHSTDHTEGSLNRDNLNSAVAPHTSTDAASHAVEVESETHELEMCETAQRLNITLPETCISDCNRIKIEQTLQPADANAQPSASASSDHLTPALPMKESPSRSRVGATVVDDLDDSPSSDIFTHFYNSQSV